MAMVVNVKERECPSFKIASISTGPKLSAIHLPGPRRSYAPMLKLDFMDSVTYGRLLPVVSSYASLS